MDVYLVQHGQALAAELDPQRPLSEEGRVAVAKLAGHLAALGTQLLDPPITEVRHSGKLRAEQTAEIYARAVCPSVTPTASAGMNPNDDPRPLHKELVAGRDRDGALLLVGHLPHLARLSGLMLAGDPARAPVRFVNAGVLKIGPAPEGWVVEWYATPAWVR
jgi:phosphohistidine phosphatase